MNNSLDWMQRSSEAQLTFQQKVSNVKDIELFKKLERTCRLFAEDKLDQAVIASNEIEQSSFGFAASIFQAIVKDLEDAQKVYGDNLVLASNQIIVHSFETIILSRIQHIDPKVIALITSENIQSQLLLPKDKES